jgi:hypothetical protein
LRIEAWPRSDGLGEDIRCDIDWLNCPIAPMPRAAAPLPLAGIVGWMWNKWVTIVSVNKFKMKGE